MWDTAGQERFKAVSNSYMRNANGCIAVYDITKKSSFIIIESLISDFLEFTKSKIKSCANKYKNLH